MFTDDDVSEWTKAPIEVVFVYAHGNNIAMYVDNILSLSGEISIWKGLETAIGLLGHTNITSKGKDCDLTWLAKNDYVFPNELSKVKFDDR